MAINRKGDSYKINDEDVTGILQDLEGRQQENVKYQAQINDIKLQLRDITAKQEHPDAKMHQIVSFIKSGVRIIGYGLIPFNLIAAAIVLVVSEVIGIIEELV